MTKYLLYCSLEQSIFFIVLSLLIIVTFTILMILHDKQFKDELKENSIKTLILL